MGKILVRAATDTRHFFEVGRNLVIAGILATTGVGVRWFTGEPAEKLLAEILSWVLYAGLPAMAFFVLTFLYFLVTAPVKIRAEAAEAREAELANKNEQLEAALASKESPKEKIRASLASINPSILVALDRGETSLYVVATESKYHAFLECADTLQGRQYVAAVAVRGTDIGSDNRIGPGEPHRDSITDGTKLHFTLCPRDALRNFHG